MKTRETKEWLRSLIKVRRRLITTGRSRKNILQMTRTSAFILNHLEANDYNEINLARFFVRHRDKIRSLIPENPSRLHDKYMKDFHRLLFHCEMELKFEQADRTIEPPKSE